LDILDGFWLLFPVVFLESLLAASSAPLIFDEFLFLVIKSLAACANLLAGVGD
jgi:hypothetical protein